MQLPSIVAIGFFITLLASNLGQAQNLKPSTTTQANCRVDTLDGKHQPITRYAADLRNPHDLTADGWQIMTDGEREVWVRKADLEEKLKIAECQNLKGVFNQVVPITINILLKDGYEIKGGYAFQRFEGATAGSGTDYRNLIARNVVQYILLQKGTSAYECSNEGAKYTDEFQCTAVADFEKANQ
jgi:hypothetical protein